MNLKQEQEHEQEHKNKMLEKTIQNSKNNLPHFYTLPTLLTNYYVHDKFIPRIYIRVFF